MAREGCWEALHGGNSKLLSKEKGNRATKSTSHIVVMFIVSSSIFCCAVVDSFLFGAVWILSTRRLSVVRFVSRCCGFFPLQSRVDSFHSAAHRRRRSRCHRHRRRHRGLLLSCIGSCMRAARRTRGASQPADYTDNHKELTLLPAHQITPCRTQAHTPQATCSTAMWCRAQVTASAVPKRRRRLRSSSAWWC